jgi:hypothetical protein
MEQMDKQPEVRMRFIQSRLPTDLYEWLRLRAFLLRQSMNSIVLEAVADYRTTVEAGEVTPTKGAPERDAIVKYNVRVDEDLYEWLRTTAFFARVSINTLLIAALVRFREAHQDTPAPRLP